MATGLAQDTQGGNDFMSGTEEESLERRLNDPKVVSGLNRLLDRIDSIAFVVEAFEGFVARGDVIADSLASAVSELKGAQPKGYSSAGPQPSAIMSFVEHAPEMLDTGAKLASISKQAKLDELSESHLVERLTDPQTLAILNQLLDKLPLIAMLTESLDGFIRRGDTIADNVAGVVHDLKLSENAIDFEKLSSLIQTLPKLQQVGEHMLQSGILDEDLPKVIDAGVTMINSGMLDKPVVETLGELGRAGVETFHEVKQQSPPPLGGLWSMLRASRDPDVQKTLGFGFAFAKAFAKHLK